MTSVKVRNLISNNIVTILRNTELLQYLYGYTTDLLVYYAVCLYVYQGLEPQRKEPGLKPEPFEYWEPKPLFKLI